MYPKLVRKVPTDSQQTVKADTADDDEYEWVYYNAMDCRDCSQANQVFGVND